MTIKTKLEESDIIDTKKYEAIRNKFRKDIVEEKKLRRIAVGPYATFTLNRIIQCGTRFRKCSELKRVGKNKLKMNY